MYEKCFSSESPNCAEARDEAPNIGSLKSAPGKIFSVDDSLDNLFLIEAILSDFGEYEVASFSDATTALQAIKQNPPALLLLDVMMPDMTGPELLQKLQDCEGLSDFPVIMVTAKDMDQIDPESISQANDFILKPFKIDSFLEKVKSQLAGQAA